MVARVAELRAEALRQIIDAIVAILRGAPR
jgi:hypothetical protein